MRDLTRQFRRLAGTGFAVLGFALLCSVGIAQDGLTRAEALMQQARTEANRFLQTKDGKAKDATSKALKEAEKLLTDLQRANPACEKCQEELVAATFLRAVSGLSKNYQDCIDQARRALATFPANGRLALLQGLSHYYKGEFAAATKLVKRYLGSQTRTPDRDAIATPILQDSQARFLNSWYNQANFYQSAESRLTRLNTQTFANEVTFQVTPEWELQAANQVAPNLLKQAPALQDPELQAYLEQLVSRLTSRTPGPNYQYRLTVLNATPINAVTVPGQVFIYTGLLQFVETEAELAGVMAHELAHNYGHHAARTVIKQTAIANVGNALVAAANPQSQTAQLVTGIVSQLGMNLFFRAYSRFEEKEADLYGAHILFNAGYNPTAMSQFNLKMYQRNPRQPVTFLSTHPAAPDRADYLSDYLEAFDLSQPLTVDSEAFKRIKLKFPSAPSIPGLVPQLVD